MFHHSLQNIKIDYLKQMKIFHNFWTKEQHISDAKKYFTKKEWSENSNAAYAFVSQKGWMEECCAHMKELQKPNGYWTKERCILEARKYKTKTEWQKKSGASYVTSRKNGSYQECVKHMLIVQRPKGYWTKERCLVDSKRFSCAVEWKKKSSTPYSIAHRNGWWKECKFKQTPALNISRS